MADEREADDRATDALVEMLRGKIVGVLTGAGVSTESGIPDYRGPETARRARNPIQWAAFAASEKARARYWARSMAGWPKIAGAKPNDGHVALAELESRGVVRGVITQNVDRLHHAAGSRDVIELHGALIDVRCMTCGARERRESMQRRMLAMNPAWVSWSAEYAPDGDAELSDDAVRTFRVAHCVECGGWLRPDVVFFGENVAREKVDAAYAQIDTCEALLVAGTSLTVFSGYRFVRRAADRNIPVAIVNLGATRGDAYAALRVHRPCGVALRALARGLI